MKRFAIAVTAAAMILASGAGARAAAPANPVEVNLYGASAQYLFWNDLADNFLGASVANGGAGCSNVEGPMAIKTSEGDNGITWGSSCQGITGNPNIIYRYSSKNSCGGLQAVTGSATGFGCSNPRQRQMADETTCSGSSCGNVKCVTVTAGAADVAATSLIQTSKGEDKGRCKGGWKEYQACGADASGLASYRPIVVPFGFFVNKAVQQRHCVGGTKAGSACGTVADCGTGATSCTSGDVELSRLMAVMIFSGQIADWSDFGTSFNALPMEVCLRHAGSGTHATLDNAVMRGSDWGWGLIAEQLPYTTGDYFTSNPPPSQTAFWFNNGSGDMMRCVNGDYHNGTACTTSGQAIGAIGYADADQKITDYGQVYGPLKYNGYKPYAYNIKNGLYDNFWSAQWIYEDCNGNATCSEIVSKLISYASSHVPDSKADFWVPQNDMRFFKQSDVEYPSRNF